MAERSQGEVMRAALAVLTYPHHGDLQGLHALIGDWSLEDFVLYISATQVILEELTNELGQQRVEAVVDRLRRRSYLHD